MVLWLQPLVKEQPELLNGVLELICILVLPVHLNGLAVHRLTVLMVVRIMLVKQLLNPLNVAATMAAPLLPDLPMELRLVMKEELVLVIALLPVVTTDGLAPEWELVM
jgi:hypothetical protein